jgi:molybdenum cofactor synthesis domain-containing protein
VPDEQQTIEERLRAWADSGSVDLICTTGGTGLGPRDVTPEATANVIELEVPGMAEAIRAQTYHITPFSMVSRARVGVRGKTLIVNLPGSPTGAVECLEVLLPVLPHALEVLQDRRGPHPVE